MLFLCHPKILHRHCFCEFLLGTFYLPRETEDNAFAKFWGEKQRALWYVMVFSGAVNIEIILKLVLPTSVSYIVFLILLIP